jgi:hypothetical protein
MFSYLAVPTYDSFSGFKATFRIIHSLFGWRPFLFFRKQAGELLVIVLSLREKHMIQLMRETGPKNHTNEAIRRTTHPKHTRSTHLAQSPAKKAHDWDTGHRNRFTTEATTQNKP